MEYRRCLLLALVSCLALAATGCSPGGDSSSPPVETAANVRDAYLALSALEGRASYSIIYALNESGDLRRAKAGSAVRWDDAFSRENTVAGTTAISTGGGWSICGWASSVGSDEVEVSCDWGGESRWSETFSRLLSLSEEILDVTSLLESQRTFVGRETQCFDIENLLVTGTVCYSDDGLPLFIEARDSRGGLTQTAVAVDIQDAPSESNIAKPLVSQPPYSFPVRQFESRDVSLPPLPKVGALAE
jgi:hypothetical protein